MDLPLFRRFSQKCCTASLHPGSYQAIGFRWEIIEHITRQNGIAHVEANIAAETAPMRWDAPVSHRSRSTVWHGCQRVSTPPATAPIAHHADNRWPPRRTGRGYRHCQPDQRWSAPPAECGASNAPRVAADRSRFPALLDRPAQAGTLHSFPIDRDARCIVQ
jgi:hypothetical protein